MTIIQLLEIPPAELAALTDEQLAAKLEPLIPAARSEYVGRRTEVVEIGDKVVSRREYTKKTDQLFKALLAAQAAQNKAT